MKKYEYMYEVYEMFFDESSRSYFSVVYGKYEDYDIAQRICEGTNRNIRLIQL